MDGILRFQLTFDGEAYPAATQALSAFASPRSRCDYLKSILEAHFKSLQLGHAHQSYHGPHQPARPGECSSIGPRDGLNEDDVAHIFSNYFPT